MKKNLFPLLGIALAVAILATLLFYGLFLSRLPSGTPAGVGQPVVIAAHNLDRGATLAAGDLRVITWSSQDQIKGSFHRPEQILGWSVVQPIGENEPVTETRLTSSQSGAGAGLGVPSGMRAVSVHVVDSTGVVAMLRPGHKVDFQVVGSLTRATPEDTRLKTLLQQVEVLSVNPQWDSSGGRSGGQVLTLLATPAEADLLGLADSVARLRVTLRNPLDDQRRQPPVLAPAALFERGSMVSAPVAVRAAAAVAAPARVSFQVQMAAANPVALNELASRLESPRKAGSLEVLAFRRGFDLTAAVRDLCARNLLEVLAPTNLTAGERGDVSVYNAFDGGDGGRVTIRFLPSVRGDAGLRWRVQPEIVAARGARRGIDTEVELRDGQSLLVAGLVEPKERPAILKRLFPARNPERLDWELVILVRSQIVTPLHTAALGTGR